MMGYYTIAVIALLAAMSPGPDFAIVAKYALSHNRQSAVMASLGIGAGVIIHVSYCVLGFALVIAHSLILFSIIKYLGAAYLIYLGLKSLLGKANQVSTNTQGVDEISLWRGFRDGLLTNVLNPKCTLFMLSVFTLVVKPNTALWVQAIYGAEIVLITVVWFVFLAYGLTIKQIQSRIATIQPTVTKLIGAALLALGVMVLVAVR